MSMYTKIKAAKIPELTFADVDAVAMASLYEAQYPGLLALVARHQSAWEHWPHGAIKDIVIRDGYPAVYYTCKPGDWYHYDVKKGEWW